MELDLDSPARVLRITPRERRALQFLANGATATEVALRLGVSRPESDALLAGLFAAMGVTTLADAVAGARRRGLLA